MPDLTKQGKREMLWVIVPLLSPGSRGRLRKKVQVWLWLRVLDCSVDINIEIPNRSGKEELPQRTGH